MSGRHRKALNLKSCLTDSSRIHLIELIKLIQHKIGKTWLIQIQHRQARTMKSCFLPLVLDRTPWTHSPNTPRTHPLNRRAVCLPLECFLLLLQIAWKGFTNNLESERGYKWTYWIRAPVSCRLPGLKGKENQQFSIEKYESCVRPNGTIGYNIFVQYNSPTTMV